MNHSDQPSSILRLPAVRPILSGRAAIPLGSLLYTFLYVQIYAVMASYWDYLGFTMLGYDRNYHFAAYFLVPLASLGLRNDDRTLGSFIMHVLFVVLFAPCIITPFLQGSFRFYELFTSGGLLAASFLFICWSVRWGRRTADVGPPPSLFTPGFFWAGLVGLWAALNLYVIASFFGQLRFAGFADVYEQRYLADSVAAGGLVFYAIFNLAGAVNPLILALGLRRHSAGLVAMGIISQLLMYSTSALRSIIASTLVMIVLHFVLGREGPPRNQLILPGILAVLVGGLLFLPFYSIFGVIDQLMTIVFVRTIMTPGVIYGVYMEFFSVYPVTHFSHINIIGTFTEYPYGVLQIGQVVGEYMVQKSGLEVINANANYLATDGLGSFWVAGIPIIGLVSAVLFRLTDRLLSKTDTRLCCMAMVGVLMSLANVSIFTTIVSFGGFLLVALLWAVPRAGLVLDRGQGWNLL